MVVQHNLLSMNANRQLGITRNKLLKNTEKLSSGYKINRSADDAAGLAISEKLRRQIRGLTQASTNCLDGISLVQIADGALNETHDLLQRMNELAVQSANGTNTDSDRENIQDEMKNLLKEVDRIAIGTSFNEEIRPLDASLPIFNSFSLSWGSLNGMANTSLYNGNDLSFESYVTNSNYNYSYKVGAIYSSPNLMNVPGHADMKLTIILDDCKNSNGEFLDNDETCSKGGHFSGASGYLQTFLGSTFYPLTIDLDLKPNTTLSDLQSFLSSITLSVGNDHSINILGLDDYIDTSSAINNKSIFIQAGADNSSEQRIPIKLVNATTSGLGISSVNVSTKDNACNSISKISDAINTVSDYRSYFGATQNRLEHTIKNLDNIVENTQASESQIRDTDMAKEMVYFSNNNILAQSGQSMLAQANQNSQGILSLLQQ